MSVYRYCQISNFYYHHRLHQPQITPYVVINLLNNRLLPLLKSKLFAQIVFSWTCLSRGKFKHVRFFFFFFFFLGGGFSSLQQVSETSPRRLRDLLETKETGATLRRRLRDLLETGKSPPPQKKKNRTCLNFPRLPVTRLVSMRHRGDIAETRVATRSPPSLQASEIGPQLPETSRRLPGELDVISGDFSETSPW